MNCLDIDERLRRIERVLVGLFEHLSGSSDLGLTADARQRLRRDVALIAAEDAGPALERRTA